MSARTASWAGWSACGLTLAIIACAILFSTVNGALNSGSIFLVSVVACALVGGLVSFRRPRNPIGWLLLGSALSFALQEFAIQYAVYGLRTEPGSLPLARAVAWPPTWLWVPGVFLTFAFLPLYFPDGRLPSRRWRPVACFMVGASVVSAASAAFLLPTADDRTGLANPLAVEAPGPVLLVVNLGLLPLAVAFVSAASLIVRFRRSRGEERQQIR